MKICCFYCVAEYFLLFWIIGDLRLDSGWSEFAVTASVETAQSILLRVAQPRFNSQQGQVICLSQLSGTFLRPHSLCPMDVRASFEAKAAGA
jgi:hypothetical protein